MGSVLNDLNKQIMNTIEYWKERCRLAEELLMETPHSLSETNEQKIAHDRWNEFKTLPIPDVSGRSEQLCRTFAPDGTTSSATKCVFCGKECYLH